MKKLFLLLLTVFAVTLCASAQMRTVTGTVVDATTDEPLVGASVTPGTGHGVITDIDGNFTIQVAKDVKALTVSYVGYATEKVVITGKALKVALQPTSETLDPVMVVAYGKVKKSEYTGAASVVSSEQLQNALVSNVTNALTGKMAGVQTFSSNGQPGTSSSVVIRGVGSINTSSSPLYVVDGLPFDGGDISAIPNSDIESITVLKDAASTALYGARGANGVIIVTTKSGKSGDAKVTVDMRWGANQRAIPQYDVVTNERQYLEMMYQSMDMTNQFFQGMTPEQSYVNVNNNFWNTLGYQTWTIPQGQYIFNKDGKFNPNAIRGYSNGKYTFLADDWTKEGLMTGLRQEYNLSVTGGTEKLKYYVSASYLSDEGIIRNSDFSRLSTRAGIDYQAKKWLTIGSNMSYAYTNSRYPDSQTNDDATSSGNVFYFVNGMGPVYPCYVRDAEGNIMINKTYGNKIYDYGDGADYGNGRIGYTRSPNGNPISQLIYDKTDYLTDIFDGKWYATINPVKGLDVTGKIGYYVLNQRAHQILNGVYGQFTSIGGQAVQEADRVRSLQEQAMATYEFSVGANNFRLMAAYENQDYQEEFVYALGSNLYDPSSFVVNNTIDSKNGGGAQANLVHQGFIGSLNYNFDNRYYAMLSFRRDGSSRFAPNHRWGSFWSASAGWDLNKEKFMQSATWIDYLKIKASVGQNGNDNIGRNFKAYPDWYQMKGADGVFSDATLVYKGNEDITWEKSTAYNAGVDFSFWHGKLSGSLDYYSRQTNDMLLKLPTPPSLGYSSIPMNVGGMRNSGFEIDLNYRPVNTKDITWDIYMNMTFQKNKVTKLDPSILNSDGEWEYSSSRIIKEGASMYNLWLVEYAGVDEKNGEALYKALRQATNENGDLLWKVEPVKDADGNVIKEGEPLMEEYNTPKWTDARNTNRKQTGNTLPTAFGGFGTTLNAYGFDLSVSFSYQFGGKIIDYGYQNYTQSGANIGATWHKDMLNAWTPENTKTDVPRLYTSAQYAYANSLSTRYLISSNYLSLNNITLGYTLPSKLTKKAYLNTVRVYVAAENVALWSKRKGLDPRQGNISSENSTYSPIRALAGGIRVEF